MRHRQRFIRTRTGCLTCRRRRKKCDEAKPICIGCFRNQLECSWPIDKLPHHEASQPNRESRHRGRQSETSGSDGRDYDPVQSPRISAVAGIRNEGGIDSDTDVFLSVTGTPPEDMASSQALSPQTLEWNPGTELYLGATRAPLMHSSSRLLLRHYLESTSALLAAKPMRSNPFVTLIMPLAHCDDLLMHAILALSGTHYICKYPSATDIRQSTWKHYAVVIKTLRKVQRLSVVSPEESLHLLATLMVLCHVEVISGECNGAVYPHLRVSRHLILKLLQGPANCKSMDDQDLKGFILETYAYLVLVANITPYGEAQDRTLPLDNFVTSLEPLQQYSTFGTFVGCGYWLFEKIADISRLSMQRLEEERIGKSSRESISTYEALLSSLNDWEPNVLGLDIHPWEAKKALAGEVYRHSILIYLKASMCGSVVGNPKVVCEIQSHIDVGLELLLNLDDSPFGTIMLWPIMIMGSCLIKLDQRLLLEGYCQKSKFQMSHVSKAADLLRLVWEDSDRRAYGPYGLHFIMEKHAINFCMA